MDKGETILLVRVIAWTEGMSWTSLVNQKSSHMVGMELFT